jgi:RimJ/RimL family protein N-acetyltransferase
MMAFAETHGPVLETSRLLLRPFRRGDERALVQHLITDCLAHPASPVNGCRFALERRADRVVIGGAAITPFPGGFELGYWLGKDYWGAGLGTEAARGATDFGFGVLGMRRIDAFVFDGNPASVRLLEKIGFHYVGLSEDAPARHRGPVHHFVQDQPFDQ